MSICLCNLTADTLLEHLLNIRVIHSHRKEGFLYHNISLLLFFCPMNARLANMP